MMSQEEAERVLGTALETARQGVDEAEASLVGGTLGVTRFADNEVHQAVQISREVLAVRVVVGGRMARTETSDITVTGLKIAARQARMMAELMPRPEVPATLPPRQNYRAIDDFDADTERATPLDRMAHVGRTIMQAHKDGLHASGYVATSFGGVGIGTDADTPYALANTHGLMAYHAGTRASMSVTMRRPDGATGWADGQAFALGALDAQGLLERAVSKAKVAGEPRALTPGPYTVILEPAAVAGLLEYVGHLAGSEDVEAGRSFLSGKTGQAITGRDVTIVDDFGALLHRGVPFDLEGVARRRVPLIEGGVARGPVYGFARARKAGAEPTGHARVSPVFGEGEAAEHLVMSGGDASVESVLAATPRGVLISRLWYVRLVDPRTLTITAVTRDGTFLIEGGQVVARVRDMRINVSVLDVLGRIEAMSEPEWAQGAVVPALRLAAFPLGEPVPGYTAGT